MFSLASIRWIWSHRPDFVIVCDPNSLLHAFLLQLFGRCKIVYIEYDAPNVGVRWRDWLNLKIRTCLSSFARLAVFPSELRYEIFRRQTGKDMHHFILPNYPRMRELAETTREFGANEPDLTLYYQGSFVPPRVPRELFEAISKCPFVKFNINAVPPVPDNFYQATVESWIREFGIEDRVKFLPMVADVDGLKSYAQGAHVGLALYDMSKATDINHLSMWGASNKLTQYLGYGLILLYAAAESAIKGAVGSFGVECDPHNPEDIARCLRLIHQNLPAWNGPRKLALQRMKQEWNFESGFEKFYQALQKLSKDT